jgi:hypothetical protein
VQRKTNTIIGDYCHVAASDPALDQEAEGFEDLYRRSVETGDLSLLPRKEGAEPVVWRFRHLSAAEGAWLADEAQSGGSTLLCLNAAALALVAVEGPKEDDGRPVKVARRGRPLPGSRPMTFVAVAAEQLDELVRRDGRLDVTLLAELGSRVLDELTPRSG